MDDNMIERVAKGLLNARMRLECPSFAQVLAGLDPDAVHLQMGLARMLARAALEAMREPTEDVLREGADKMRYGKQVVPPHHAKFVWQAMIDAALAQ
jgi:hypothetical protein